MWCSSELNACKLHENSHHISHDFYMQALLISPTIPAPLKSILSSFHVYFHGKILNTNPFSTTYCKTFLKGLIAQRHYLWWWEASSSWRAFWQHSEFLVSAALAGRWRILRAPLLTQQEAAEVRMNSRYIPGSRHIVAWVVPV